LKNTFHPIKAGITPYFKIDHDLIEVVQALITPTPIVISSSLVKGHYTGKIKEYQHVLNQEADNLAGQYQDRQVPHHTIQKPLPPPNYKIC
jgi:type II secretory pathway component GspD/PulD (secretin)